MTLAAFFVLTCQGILASCKGQQIARGADGLMSGGVNATLSAAFVRCRQVTDAEEEATTKAEERAKVWKTQIGSNSTSPNSTPNTSVEIVPKDNQAAGPDQADQAASSSSQAERSHSADGEFKQLATGLTYLFRLPHLFRTCHAGQLAGTVVEGAWERKHVCALCRCEHSLGLRSCVAKVARLTGRFCPE